MSKENKIIQYNLEDEVKQLREMNYSVHDIAKRISDNHPEIHSLKNLSGMSISRYIRNAEEKELQGEVTEGKDPVKDFTEMYRDEVDDIHEKTKELYEKSIIILKDIEEGSQDYNVKLKAIKEVRDNLNQMLKNQVSLKQYGERRANTIYNVNLKKEIHVKNLLLNFVNSLCPKCKAKISKLVEEI